MCLRLEAVNHAAGWGLCSPVLGALRCGVRRPRCRKAACAGGGASAVSCVLHLLAADSLCSQLGLQAAPAKVRSQQQQRSAPDHRTTGEKGTAYRPARQRQHSDRSPQRSACAYRLLEGTFPPAAQGDPRGRAALSRCTSASNTPAVSSADPLSGSWHKQRSAPCHSVQDHHREGSPHGSGGPFPHSPVRRGSL